MKIIGKKERRARKIASIESKLRERGMRVLNGKKKDKVQLIGFGTFETAKRAARTGKNPQTGKEIKIPASVAPKFKPGKALKDLVNGK